MPVDILCDSISTFTTAFAVFVCDNLSEMLKGLVKATVPVVKLGVKAGLCGGAVYATKEVAANFFKHFERMPLEVKWIDHSSFILPI